MLQVKKVTSKVLFTFKKYKIIRQCRVLSNNPFLNGGNSLGVLGTRVENSILIEYPKKVGNKYRTATKTIYFKEYTWIKKESVIKI